MDGELAGMGFEAKRCNVVMSGRVKPEAVRAPDEKRTRDGGACFSVRKEKKRKEKMASLPLRSKETRRGIGKETLFHRVQAFPGGLESSARRCRVISVRGQGLSCHLSAPVVSTLQAFFHKKAVLQND